MSSDKFKLLKQDAMKAGRPKTPVPQGDLKANDFLVVRAREVDSGDNEGICIKCPECSELLGPVRGRSVRYLYWLAAHHVEFHSTALEETDQ